MSLFHKPIELITETDILGLIQHQVPEGRMLDYKLILPSSNENNEFRYDVTSFANAGGGELIFGIREKQANGINTGEPEEPVPIITPLDADILRLEQILQTNIDPRLRGVRFHPIKFTAGGCVLLIRVPKSWSGLHMVRLNDSFRIYSRNSRGKYIMNPEEIRSGFVAAETGYERIRGFREKRLERIDAGDTPIPVSAGPKVVFHVMPFSMLDPTIEHDLDLLTGLDSPFPIGTDSFTYQYNFDGKVFFKPLESGYTTTYVQFYRNGIVEACANNLFNNEDKLLGSVGLESYLINALNNYLGRLKLLNVSEPFAVGLSVVRAKGCTLQIYTPKWGRPDPIPFGSNQMVVPELRIESYDEAPHTILRPAFNRIWNAAGRNGSAYYSEAGEWIGNKNHWP
jgi:hypothetical protein